MPQLAVQVRIALLISAPTRLPIAMDQLHRDQARELLPAQPLKSTPTVMISSQMTLKRQQVLYNRYPEIFRERHLAGASMHWGIDCDEVWIPIIDALCAMIMEHSKYAPHPVPAVKNVKGKAGSLRVQLDLAFE